MDRQVALAFTALAEQQDDEAERLCRRGLVRYGKLTGGEAFWVVLGWIDADARLQCWNKALARRPHHAWLLLARGTTHLRRGRRKLARKDYDAALRVNPRLMAAADAGYLEPTDRVFGVSINGEHRAYPLRILNPHEMANDVVGGVPISLAY